MIGLIICLALAFIYQIFHFNKRRKYPSGPLPFPAVGNLPLLGNSLQSHIASFVAYGKKYNGIFTLWLPDPVVIVTDYEVMQELMVNRDSDLEIVSPAYTERVFHNRNISKNPESETLIADKVSATISSYFKKISRHHMDNLINNQSLLINQLIHCSLRKDWSGEHGAFSLDSLSFAVAKFWSELLWDGSSRYALPELTEMIELFQTRLALDNDRKSMVLDEYNYLRFLPLFDNFKHKSYENAGARLRNSILPELQRRRCLIRDGASLGPDVVSEYYRVFNVESDDESVTRNHEFLCQLVDLFGYGVNTVTLTLQWTVLHMCLYPEMQVQERVYGELQLANNNDIFVSETDAKLDIVRSPIPYTIAVLAEAQRCMHIRATTQQRWYKAVNDVWLTKKAKIRKALGLDENYFPQATDFFPARFLSKSGTDLCMSLINKATVTRLGPGDTDLMNIESLQSYVILKLFTDLMSKYKFELDPQSTGQKSKKKILKTAERHAIRPRNWMLRVSKRD